MMDPEDVSVIASNLPPELDQRGLEAVFNRYGQAKIKLIANTRATFSDVHYAFAHFRTRSGAMAAIDAINGAVLIPGTQPVKVTLAKPREERGFNTNLYISGIPLPWTHTKLQEIAEPFGEVLELRLLEPQHGHDARSGFVRFARHTQSDSALRMLHGFPVCDRGWLVHPRDPNVISLANTFIGQPGVVQLAVKYAKDPRWKHTGPQAAHPGGPHAYAPGPPGPFVGPGAPGGAGAAGGFHVPYGPGAGGGGGFPQHVSSSSGSPSHGGSSHSLHSGGGHGGPSPLAAYGSGAGSPTGYIPSPASPGAGPYGGGVGTPRGGAPLGFPPGRPPSEHFQPPPLHQHQPLQPQHSPVPPYGGSGSGYGGAPSPPAFGLAYPLGAWGPMEPSAAGAGGAYPAGSVNGGGYGMPGPQQQQFLQHHQHQHQHAPPSVGGRGGGGGRGKGAQSQSQQPSRRGPQHSGGAAAAASSQGGGGGQYGAPSPPPSSGGSSQQPHAPGPGDFHHHHHHASHHSLNPHLHMHTQQAIHGMRRGGGGGGGPSANPTAAGSGGPTLVSGPLSVATGGSSVTPHMLRSPSSGGSESPPFTSPFMGASPSPMSVATAHSGVGGWRAHPGLGHGSAGASAPSSSRTALTGGGGSALALPPLHEGRATTAAAPASGGAYSGAYRALAPPAAVPAPAAPGAGLSPHLPASASPLTGAHSAHSGSGSSSSGQGGGGGGGSEVGFAPSSSLASGGAGVAPATSGGGGADVDALLSALTGGTGADADVDALFRPATAPSVTATARPEDNCDSDPSESLLAAQLAATLHVGTRRRPSGTSPAAARECTRGRGASLRCVGEGARRAPHTSG